MCMSFHIATTPAIKSSRVCRLWRKWRIRLVHTSAEFASLYGAVSVSTPIFFRSDEKDVPSIADSPLSSERWILFSEVSSALPTLLPLSPKCRRQIQHFAPINWIRNEYNAVDLFTSFLCVQPYAFPTISSSFPKQWRENSEHVPDPIFN